MKIEISKDVQTEDIMIQIRVPSEHILRGKSTPRSRRIAEMIDMDQFFGMLEDAVNMKLGIETEKGAL